MSSYLRFWRKAAIRGLQFRGIPEDGQKERARTDQPGQPEWVSQKNDPAPFGNRVRPYDMFSQGNYLAMACLRF